MLKHEFEHISDEELLLQVRANNSRAFKALFNRYYHPLCKFISIYVHDQSLSEEIVSDIFVSLWELKHKSNIRNVKNYLFISARNLSFNRLRKKTLPVTYSDTLENYNNVLSDGTSPLTVIHTREAQQEIIGLIEKLPSRQREVLLMSRIAGIENDEIASLLGISLKTVQATLYEAIRELRSLLFRAQRTSDT